MTIYYKTPAIGEKIETIGVEIVYIEDAYFSKAFKCILENDGNERGLLCVQYYPSFYGKIAERRRNKKALEKMNQVLEMHKTALKKCKTLETLAYVSARFVSDGM